MSNYNNFDNQPNSSGEDAIIQRYSEMRAQNLNSFFDVEEFEAIIDWYISLYDTSEASQAIENGLRQHPQSFDIRLRKAQLHLIRGEGKEALSIANALELIEPSNIDLIVLKADILSYLDHNRRAAALYKKAMIKAKGDRLTDIKLSLGLVYARTGNPLDAISLLKEVAIVRPWDPLSLEELRSAYQQADLSEEGSKTFSHLTDLEPYSFQAWFQLGLLYNQQSLWRKSLDALEIALVLVPADEAALLSKAEAFYQLDMYQKAIETYQEVKQPLEKGAAILCGIGECYEQLGNNEKALEYYDKCLEIESFYADAFLGKAIVLDHMGQAEKALGNLRIALIHEPNNYEFWHVYGEILSREGDLSTSIEALEKSLSLEKEDVDVHKGYIDTLYDAGLYEKALLAVEEAFEHVGHDINIYIRAVALLSRCKSELEAEKMLEMLLRAHPGAGWQLIEYDQEYLTSQQWLVNLIEDGR